MLTPFNNFCLPSNTRAVDRDKVLCVDDDRFVLSLLEMTLGQHYDVFAVDSVQDALDVIKITTDFTVIISDYEMPGLNGIEFLRRAKSASPDSMQIMYSSVNNWTVIDKAETEIFRFLTKPAPQEMIKQTVADAAAHYRMLRVNSLCANQP